MLMKFVYPISSFIQILYLCKFKVWDRFSLIIIYYIYGKLDYIFFPGTVMFSFLINFIKLQAEKVLTSLEIFPSLYSFLFGVLPWGEWFCGDKPGSNKLGQKWENFSILSEIWKRQQNCAMNIENIPNFYRFNIFFYFYLISFNLPSIWNFHVQHLPAHWVWNF